MIMRAHTACCLFSLEGSALAKTAVIYNIKGGDPEIINIPYATIEGGNPVVVTRTY